jgi:LDH2 family malate/lactate/ureidoglycolate dehydrogenase
VKVPGYPIVEGEIRVSAAVLLKRVQTIFERCAMSPADAHLLADSLVVADLRGVHSHGVLRVPEYVRKLTQDGVNPGGRPFIARDSGAVLVVDGNNAMGQVAGHFAMSRVIERAANSGIAAAGVRGSNHCGALFYFARMALPYDCIGIAATNALPTMAPWGGLDKILGINPLAVAIPADEEPPVILDAAFSASSHGKIRVFHQKGVPIPEGWALDKHGHATTDASEALDGLLQPIGEYKGTGLAIVVGILSSMLSGAAFGTELGNMVDGPKPGADGHFVMALRVAAFEDVVRFKTRVDGVVRRIRESRPAPGFDRCYAPGELEQINEQEYRREGIPLTRETIAGLEAAERETAASSRSG